jgi:hydrogenase-4 component F
MILLPAIIPAAAAVLAFIIRSNPIRRALLVLTACAHALLTAWCWVDRPRLGEWIAIDSAGLLFLTVTSLLFLAASIYAVGFLKREGSGMKADVEEGFLFDNTPEALFTACLLAFLAAMTLVTMSRHFGLLWVAVEATTLVSAPLIHFHRHHRSLEATWKYLLICSVGIAVALLGTYFLSAAGSEAGVGLTFSAMASAAERLDPAWLKAGFLLLLVGYGTKMGLAPMHTWLPDAHSEAPSVVSALLSGALLNCAFLGILRIHGVMSDAGLGRFSADTLLVFGLLSMGAAAVFIIGQPDFKRLLAYSSVENMGILAVGIGIGGLGEWGALYHALNHSLVKAALFFTAGNILAAYGTKKAADVRGVISTLPISGVLWTAGFLAITGAPPFGTFVSELSILRAALDRGSYWAAAGYLLALTAVFIGMASVVISMAQGRSAAANADAPGKAPFVRMRESAAAVIPPIALLAVSAASGLVVPRFLDDLIRETMKLLGGMGP